MRSMLTGMKFKWVRTPNSRFNYKNKKIKAHKPSKYYEYLSEKVRF